MLNLQNYVLINWTSKYLNATGPKFLSASGYCTYQFYDLGTNNLRRKTFQIGSLKFVDESWHTMDNMLEIIINIG